MNAPALFQLNGKETAIPSDSGRSLLGVLRDDLGLTGAKYGCGEGQCGACTVLLDGRPVRSCVTRLEALAGHSVRTIEDLEKGGKLHAVQQAFLDADAFQCGYCATGMILSAVALLERHSKPEEAQIREAMQGNICRCGIYNRVRKAIHLASENLAAAQQ